ncbi:MAG: ABC transporter permease [Candidatus Hydrothermarchaeales archaeon]
MKKVLTLSKKEFKDIIGERVYIMAFFVQMIIVMGIIYAALLYTAVAAPETSSFVRVEKPGVGIIGDENWITSELRKDLRISFVTGDPRTILENSNLVAVLVFPPDFETQIQRDATDLRLVIDNTNLLSGYADTVVTETIQKYSAELKKERLSLRYEDPDAVLNPIRFNTVYVKTSSKIPHIQSPEFIEIMYGILIPFILLLPTFLSANMVTDSIVGEKEKRTYEILIAAPISKSEIILGKTLPVVALALLQALLWMILLRWKGTIVYNMVHLLLLLFLLDLVFIGFGIVISAMSENIKESNLSVTILIIVASLSFFAPLSLKKEFYNISPVTLISKFSSNPYVDPRSILLPFLLIFIASVLTILIGARLLETRESLRL